MQLEDRAKILIRKFNALLKSQVHNYRITQFILIGVSLMLCVLTVFFFSALKKQN